MIYIYRKSLSATRGTDKINYDERVVSAQPQLHQIYLEYLPSDPAKLKARVLFIFYMSMASETLEVTIKYNGIKGERMVSRMTSQTEAVRILLADLVTLRVHRPKGENILQEGATFFLLWCHPANAPVSLARVCPKHFALRHDLWLIRCQGTLYRRWLDIVEGSPELTAIKEKLSM